MHCGNRCSGGCWGPFGRRGVARRRSCPAHMNGVGKASRRRCLNRALKLFAGTATKRGRNWLAGCGCGNVANGHRAATAFARGGRRLDRPRPLRLDTASRDGGPRAQSFVGTTARLVARPPPDEKPGSRKDGSHSQRDTKAVVGAPGTARTCNPQIRSLVLYPLSYGRFRRLASKPRLGRLSIACRRRSSQSSADPSRFGKAALPHSRD